MIITRKLISKFLDISNISDNKIVDALNSLGYEVERYNQLSNLNTNIVLGKIIELKKAENSDHLNLTKVQISKTKVLNIVCGANNLRDNMYVIVALIGSKLANGLTIKQTKILNHPSEGMICSFAELGYKHESFDLKTKSIIDVIGKYANEKYIGSENILDLIGLDDSIFEYDITANRSYGLSAYDVIDELSVFFNKKIANKNLLLEMNKCNINNNIQISSQTNDIKAFASVFIKINNAKSILSMPFSNLLSMLEISNKNINGIADYVAIEQGQPIILLDADKIKDKLVWANNFVNKADQIYKNNLVLITENIFVNLLGIKQNPDFAITSNTQNIIAIAVFADSTVLRNQQKQFNTNNINIQRYMRFNTGINIVKALKRFLNLLNDEKYLLDYSKIIEHKPYNFQNKKIQVDIREINKLIGNDIPIDNVVKLLSASKFSEIKLLNQNQILEVQIPSLRYNLQTCDDLIEEILRLYGYSNINAVPPIMKMSQNPSDLFNNNLDVVNNFLISNNFYEVKTFSLISAEENKKFNFFNYKNEIKLIEPLTNLHETMQLSILNNLLKIINYNSSYNQKIMKIFTMENIYFDNDKNEYHLALMTKGEIINHKITKSFIPNSFFYLKGIFISLINKLGLNEQDFIFENKNINNFFHPFQSSYVYYNNNLCAIIGSIHPSNLVNLKEEIFGLEINLTKLFSINIDNIKYKQKIKNNIITRDMTICLIDKSYDFVKNNLIKNIKFLQKVKIKDYYIQDNNDSQAFLTLSFIFNSSTEQLTDVKINTEYDKIIANARNLKLIIKN